MKFRGQELWHRVYLMYNHSNRKYYIR